MKTKTAARVTRTVDLRPTIARWGLGARSQGKRPTCSVFATVNAIEFALAARKDKGLRMSQEYLNWAKNQATGTEQDGGFFHDIWAGYAKYGLAGAETVPYAETYDPAFSPSERALREGKKFKKKGLKLHFIKRWDIDRGLAKSEFDTVLKRIDEGFPVMCGFRWAKKAEFVDDVMVWCPPEEVFDGHSVLIVGYVETSDVEGGGYLILSDSASVRDDLKMSFKFARHYANDACWVK
jgi:hypothetical protein